MLLSVMLLAISPRTIIFIVLVLVIFFGAKRIPELFRGVGQGIREFKDASQEPRPEFRDQPNGMPNQQPPYQQQPQAPYPQQAYQQPQQPTPQPPQNYTPNPPQA